MKKIMIIALVALALSGSAFAATLDVGEGGKQLRGTVATGQSAGGLDIARMSNNVYVTANYSATGYALSTYHGSGTKAYGTGYDSTKIFWSGIGENCITGSCFAVPSSSVATEAFAGWTEM